MNVANSQVELENFLKRSGMSKEELIPSEGIRLMLDFYKQSRFKNCPADEYGDMLLYQWGTYDWGSGPFFQLDITRQFIEAGFEGDDGISQLSMYFYFYPSKEFEELKSGDRWCENPLEIPGFERYIKESSAYTKVANRKPAKMEISYSRV